jgi:hypothetical protein
MDDDDGLGAGADVAPDAVGIDAERQRLNVRKDDRSVMIGQVNRSPSVWVMLFGPPKMAGRESAGFCEIAVITIISVRHGWPA